MVRRQHTGAPAWLPREPASLSTDPVSAAALAAAAGAREIVAELIDFIEERRLLMPLSLALEFTPLEVFERMR